jgi:hypothetical protein
MKTNKNILIKLGGVDKISNDNNIVITVNDGFDKNLIMQTKNIVLESKSKMFLKNRITEWHLFKKTYYKNGKLPVKFYNKFIETSNNIFILPFFCDVNKDLLTMIKTVYDASNKQLYIAMMNNLDLFYNIKLSIKHLFMAYKCFIERNVELFMELRNQYIDAKFRSGADKTSKKNDFNATLDKWKQIDNSNNINTSSIILFFNFPSKKITLEKSIQKMEWCMSDKDDVNNLINKFLLKIKSNKFFYCGFCPFIPIERFKILTRFPITELIDTINLIQLKLNTINQTDYTNKSIKSAICCINNLSKISYDISCINNIGIEKLTKHHINTKKPKTTDQYINVFEKYIDAYLDMYEQIIPSFINKEIAINKILIAINKISNTILHACDKIVLKE